MQYAHVVVNRRLSRLDLLTYAIPEQMLAHIGIGSYVIVSLNKRPVSAVVVQFSKNIPDSLNIQPIMSVVSNGPVITHNHIRAYSELASVTLSSLSDVYFNFLPPVLKKIPVRINVDTDNPRRGSCMVFQGTTHERFHKYHSLCRSPSTSLLFLFPDYDILNMFIREIHDIPHTVYDSRQSPTARWETWQKIHNEKGIYVTTRVGIGMFPSSPTNIIIDNPTHPGFKEDRRPKYQILECIDIHRTLGHTVTVGVHHPSLVTEYICGRSHGRTLPPILLTRSKEIIPSQTIKRIKNNTRVLIVVPHKNEWGLLICKECKTVVRCPTCGRAVQQTDAHALECTSCMKSIAHNGVCTHCKSTRIHRYSIGTRGLARIFTKRFPQRSIVLVDTSSTLLTDLNVRRECIVIATQKLCDYPVIPFDYCICLGFDPLFDIPSPVQEEKILALLITYFQMGTRGEILTSRPLHRVYHALASRHVDTLQHTLLIERGDTLPPHSRTIELRSKNEIPDTVIRSFPGELLMRRVVRSHYTVTLSLRRELWRVAVEWQKTISPSIRVDPDPRSLIL